MLKLETTVNERYFKDEKMSEIIKRFLERGKQKEVSFEHIAFKIERHHDRLNYDHANNYELLNIFETKRGLGEEIFLDEEFPKFCDVCSKYCEGEAHLKKFLDEMHTMHMKIKEKGAGRHLIKTGRQKKGASDELS
jgi:hypothetical protein